MSSIYRPRSSEIHSLSDKNGVKGGKIKRCNSQNPSAEFGTPRVKLGTAVPHASEWRSPAFLPPNAKCNSSLDHNAWN
jgi:hypothetical protein